MEYSKELFEQFFMSLQYRILYIHNYYLQPGGEDVVFSQEMEILKENNHFVYKYTQDNRDVTKYSQIQMAISILKY